MTLKGVLFWTLFVASASAAPDDTNLGDLIDKVWGNSSPSPLQKPQPDNGGLGGDQCTCVPYYLCLNDKIVTDGTGLIDIRLDNKVCPQSIDVCCANPKQHEQPPNPVDPNNPGPPLPLPPPSPPTYISKGRSYCGVRHTDGVGFRITGNVNNEAQFGEFPWMIALLKTEGPDGSPLSVYKCGGALIHQKVVLTAAHCVINQNPQHLKARAGEWDTQTNQEIIPYQDRYVSKIITHKDYHAGGLFNDVALLILAEPFEFADNVDVVCLPQQDDVVIDNSCWASGWGKDVFGKQGSFQVILKRIELPIVPRKPCQEKLRTTRLGDKFRLHESFVCAGGIEGHDTCMGDGGSPLICPVKGKKDQYQQVGIVAWGIGCGGTTPAAYVNVAKFRHWIDHHMQELGLTTEYSY